MTHPLTPVCGACGRRNRLRVAALRAGVEARCGACGGALPAPAEPIAADRAGELAELVETSGLPVLVDFWAPWCGPCKAVAPEISAVAARSAGALLVVKVDTDVDPEVGRRYRIQSIPTMVLFERGVERARFSGARPAAAIEHLVRSALSAS